MTTCCILNACKIRSLRQIVLCGDFPRDEVKLSFFSEEKKVIIKIKFYIDVATVMSPFRR